MPNSPGREGAPGPKLGPVPLGAGPVDAAAIEVARREIQQLVREITELSRLDIEPDAFYSALVSRVVGAMAAIGGAVWVLSDRGTLELVYQTNIFQLKLDDAERRRAHDEALSRTLSTGGELLLPPNSSGAGDTPANPTESLLILAALKSDAGPQGVLEIFQRADTRPSSQRGYLHFVRQAAELASDYLKGRRLRQFAHKQTLWEQLEQFAQAVHRRLEVGATAFTIVNEGRRLVGCDRVSLATPRGAGLKIAAISGQDHFDKRAAQVTRLGLLAEAVAATGEPLWFTGDRDNLPPQVERALDDYVDHAHAQALAVIPLGREPAAHDAPAGTGAETSALPGKVAPHDVVGVLIAEQLADSQLAGGVRQRIDAVARHSAAALANAWDHESVFLLPLWRALGKAKWIVSARTLPKTIAVVATLVGIAAALVLIPADFSLEARGTLQPASRQDVFSGIDGVVTEVDVKHGATVETGQPLVELRNTDLEVQLADVIGRRESTLKQMRSLERALLGEIRLSPEEQNRISGQVLQLKEMLDSLERQLVLYKQKQEMLKVTSPIDGQVVTWQVRERLIRRPVRQGQVLLSIADPSGPWELELHMPEDRMGHVATAAQESGTPLTVTYILATDPGKSHQGTIAEIAGSAELRGEEGNTVLIRVAIDKSELADLRPGATVTARVACGRRSLGYVWLHDLVDFVRAKILFRL